MVLDLKELNQREANYDKFAKFATVLHQLKFKGIPRVIIMTRSRMFKHGWIYPWKKMKLKQGRWNVPTS